MTFRILLLLSLTGWVSGAFVVNVTQSLYQAEENHNITLEWTFTTQPDTTTNSISISCGLHFNRMEMDGWMEKVADLFTLDGGVVVPLSPDEQFGGRVQVDEDVLKEGRLRLYVSRLRPADSGLYLCEVGVNSRWSSEKCWLNVKAADESKPPRTGL